LAGIFWIIATLCSAAPQRAATGTIVRFYISSVMPGSQFNCWEAVPASQMPGMPGTCNVGGVLVGSNGILQPTMSGLGNLWRLLLSTKDNDSTQYSAQVSVKALQELSQVRTGSPAAAAPVAGLDAVKRKFIRLLLGVWTSSNIITVQVSKPGTDPTKPMQIFTDTFTVHRLYQLSANR
jgi:hypothetical protein